jgi:hypothetical protein
MGKWFFCKDMHQSILFSVHNIQFFEAMMRLDWWRGKARQAQIVQHGCWNVDRRMRFICRIEQSPCINRHCFQSITFQLFWHHNEIDEAGEVKWATCLLECSCADAARSRNWIMSTPVTECNWFIVRKHQMKRTECNWLICWKHRSTLFSVHTIPVILVLFRNIQTKFVKSEIEGANDFL